VREPLYRLVVLRTELRGLGRADVLGQLRLDRKDSIHAFRDHVEVRWLTGYTSNAALRLGSQSVEAAQTEQTERPRG
jgi:hypothetical protein